MGVKGGGQWMKINGSRRGWVGFTFKAPALLLAYNVEIDNVWI